MTELIVFEKNGVRVKEKISNPVTGEREVESIVSYDEFAKYSNLKWLVKAIRPRIEHNVLVGLELEKDNINGGTAQKSGYIESQEKWSKPKSHHNQWFDPFILEVVKEYQPISRKEIKRRVFERVRTELLEGDFAKTKTGNLRWEVMVAWGVSRLKNDGKIYSTGHNDWRIH